MIETNFQTTKNILTEGIVVALFSSYSYFIAFLYEYGYCKYYDIPPSFISINITNVLLAATVIFGVVSPLLIYGQFPTYLIKKGLEKGQSSTLGFYLFIFGTLLIFLVIGLSIFGTSRQTLTQALYIVLIVLVVYGLATVCLKIKYVVDVIRVKGKFATKIANNPDMQDAIVSEMNKEVDKYNKSVEEEAEKLLLRQIVFLYLKNKFGSLIYVLLLGIVLLPISYYAGYGAATKQTDFLMLNKFPNFALLRTYDDKYIAVRIDPLSNNIDKSIIVLNKESYDFFYLTKKSIKRTD